MSFAMKKSDIRILIVEDDPTLGKAIDEGLKRSGYRTDLVTTAAQAKSAAQMIDFHGLVVDCMLPQKSGVDVVSEIIQDVAQKPVVVLISGIYKDRVFAQEAIQRTRAKAFLSKPFDILELIQKFDESFTNMVEHSREPLFDLLSRTQYSSRDKLNALNSTEYIHGFDLPFIYSILLDSQISGDLFITYEDRGKPSCISFSEGTICRVQHEDTGSYFGALLLEKGFVSAAELEEALSKQNNKPIGEHLIENSSLSPHAVEIIKHEQMLIRISKTIQNTSVQVKFHEKKQELDSSGIDGYLFTQLLGDWISSKLTSDWLRSFYTPWLENPIVRGISASKMNLLKDIHISQAFMKIFGREDWPHKLQDIIAQAPNDEDEVLRGLHFLLLQGVLSFGEKNQQVENFEAKISRANKIYENLKNKNFYEILGLSNNARASEIHRSYHELAKNFHPDKLHPQAPSELRDLTQKLFSLMTEAHQTLINDTRRKEYHKVLELGLAEEVLKAESYFEEGMRHLRNGKNREARKTFEVTSLLKGARSDIVVYYLWALIKEKRRSADQQQLALKVDRYLNKVAHEDRHSPHYFFVKGMHYELTGQIQKAYQFLKHSASLDPNFLDPKREMAYIKQHYSSRKNSAFTDDLSVVVTKFFKKKSG